MNIYRMGKNHIVAIWAFIIEIIGCFFFLQFGEFCTNVLAYVGCWAIVYCLSSAYVIFKVRKEFDIFVIFIVLSYLFSFGQCILEAFGYKMGIFAFSMGRGFFSDQEILNSSAFALCAIAFTGIGFCIKNETDVKMKKERKMPSSNSCGLCQVAWVLLSISVFPTFYELYKDIVTTFSSGYANTLNKVMGIDKVCVLLSGFYVSSLLILYCFEEKKRKIVYFFLGAYVMLQLIGGSRISIFRMAIIFLIISNSFRKEISKKGWFYIGILGLAGLFVFSFVSNARNYLYLANDMPLFLKNTASELLKNNFIFSSIKEMGNTQVINTLVFTNCPAKIDFRYGLSFVRSLYSIIPNFLHLEYISIDETFSGLYNVTNAGCGASFIAEGYWNFGYFSFLFYMLFGYIWAVLSNLFKKMCCSEYIQAGKMFLIVYLMYYMIFLVRSESIELGRSFVYYALIPVLLSKCVEKK